MSRKDDWGELMRCSDSSVNRWVASQSRTSHGTDRGPSIHCVRDACVSGLYQHEQSAYVGTETMGCPHLQHPYGTVASRQ